MDPMTAGYAHGHRLAHPFSSRDFRHLPSQLQHGQSFQPQQQAKAEPDFTFSGFRRGGDSCDDSIVDRCSRVSGEGEAGRSKRRGGPSGSNNKPKLPIINAHDSDSVLLPRVMEVPGGSDIYERVAAFARRCQLGVCILSGTGAVANVTIRQPGSAGAVLMLHGQFVIMSLKGSFLPPPAPPALTGLVVYLASVQGQVVGGSVVGQLIASGRVMITAVSFAKAAYVRLPLAEEDLQVKVHHGYPPPDQLQRHQAQSAADDRSQQTAYRQFTAEPTQVNIQQLPCEGYWSLGDAGGGRPPY